MQIEPHEPSSPGISDDIIRWIEKACYVPQGTLMGKQVRLSEFQKADIRKIYDNPVGTRRAILSFGRKNGKTSLAALLLLVHLVGPKKRPNSSLFSTAQSREQAAILFDYASMMVRMSPILASAIEIKDGSKRLICPEIGSTYRALSAEATTAFGLSPSFVVHDELGLVEGPRFTLYEALETATGAQSDPLSVIISTQARNDTDLLSVLIDDALAGHDPRVVVSLHTAPKDDDPFAIETIKKANPAFNVFLNPREVLAMAADARRMPAREPEFRNLVLNQRVEALNPFIKPAQWKACAGKVAKLEGREVYAGLDLSETADLTALVVIGQVDDLWHVQPVFWLPEKGLEDKAKADHVPYDLWRDQGLLQTTPGAAVDYDYIAQYLKRELFDKHRVRKLAFDRWNFRFLRPWLNQIGFSDHTIEEVFVEFGQGTQSMSPALREFEGLILNRNLRHGNHPVLNMCAANAVVEGVQKAGQQQDSSNRKLSKKRSSGRIDGMVALAMAIGVAPLAKKVDIDAMIG